ncbi:MAG: hypothetical protein QXR30_03825 [Candidatus Woesearchaeota archaeon]
MKFNLEKFFEKNCNYSIIAEKKNYTDFSNKLFLQDNEIESILPVKNISYISSSVLSNKNFEEIFSNVSFTKDNFDYVFIENEKFIFVFNAFAFRTYKTYNYKIYSRDTSSQIIEYYKKKLKKLSSIKIKKISAKLNYLFSRLGEKENNSKEDLLFDFIVPILNDEDICYFVFFDKKNYKNTFIIFKYFFSERNKLTKLRKVSYCESTIIFPLITNQNDEYNYIEIENYLISKNINNGINKKDDKSVISRPYAYFLNLPNFDNISFNFDYFNFLNIRMQNFNIKDLNEFNILGMNCILFKIVKNESNTFEYIFSKDVFVLLTKTKKEDQKYTEIILNESIDNKHTYLTINQIKFDKNSNYTINKLMQSSSKCYHNLNGPAQIHLIFDEKGKIDFKHQLLWYKFNIDKEEYELDEYIQKLRIILKENEFAKFVVSYL